MCGCQTSCTRATPDNLNSVDDQVQDDPDEPQLQYANILISVEDLHKVLWAATDQMKVMRKSIIAVQKAMESN
jgi:hypothetical protein